MLKQPNFFYSQPCTIPKEALAKFYLSTAFGLSFMINCFCMICYLERLMKRFKHAPPPPLKPLCFAETWICATIPQEIDYNSKSIYSTHKINMSLNRG